MTDRVVGQSDGEGAGSKFSGRAGKVYLYWEAVKVGEESYSVGNK